MLPPVASFASRVQDDRSAPASGAGPRPTVLSFAEARAIREEFEDLAQSMGRLAMKEGPLRPPIAYPPVWDTAFEGVNAAAAREATHCIREVLHTRSLGSSKSFNKWSRAQALPPEAPEHRCVTRFQFDPANVPARLVRVFDSLAAWQQSRVNCCGLSVAAQDYLGERFPDIQTSLLHLDGDHIVVVVGSVHERLVDVPLARWPPHLQVCDPWAHLCCPVRDYPDRFREQMSKWERDGKQLLLDERWQPPVDSRWLACADGASRMVIRQRHICGQSDDREVVNGSIDPAPTPGERATTRSPGDNS